MDRLFWILGEIVVGVLVSGVAGAIVVPVMMQAGLDTAPWVMWVCVTASLLVCILAGERLRRRRERSHVA